MKLTPFRIIFLLTLGAMINIGVAWLLAYRAPEWFSSDPPHYWSDAQRSWTVRFEPSYTVRRVIFVPTNILLADDHISPGYLLTDAALPAHVAGKMRGLPLTWNEALTFWHVGWPMPSLRCMQYTWRGTVYDTQLPPASLTRPVAEDALVLRRSGSSAVPPGTAAQIARPANEPLFLPLRPMPIGFAVNTIVYGLVAWLVFSTLLLLRSWWRIQRGQCPKCKYPIGMSAVCTECGAKVTPRQTTTV